MDRYASMVSEVIADLRGQKDSGQIATLKCAMETCGITQSQWTYATAKVKDSKPELWHQYQSLITPRAERISIARSAIVDHQAAERTPSETSLQAVIEQLKPHDDATRRRIMVAAGVMMGMDGLGVFLPEPPT